MLRKYVCMLGFFLFAIFRQPANPTASPRPYKTRRGLTHCIRLVGTTDVGMQVGIRSRYLSRSRVVFIHKSAS